MNDSERPVDKRTETMGGDVAVVEIEVDLSSAAWGMSSPEERIRRAPTALLEKILTAGTFKPIWVQLAREELARRGISPPPEA
jgi:hypothetical protein